MSKGGAPWWLPLYAALGVGLLAAVVLVTVAAAVGVVVLLRERDTGRGRRP